MQHLKNCLCSVRREPPRKQEADAGVLGLQQFRTGGESCRQRLSSSAGKGH